MESIVIEGVDVDPKRMAVLMLHPLNELLKYKAGLSVYGPEVSGSHRKAGIIEHMRTLIDGFLRAFRPGLTHGPIFVIQ